MLVLLAACGDPERELAQCKVVVDYTTDALASCLVRLHDWDSAAATRAELSYDAAVRSERRAIQAKLDSAEAMRRRQNLARARWERLEYCRSIGVAPADCNTDGYLGGRLP